MRRLLGLFVYCVFLSLTAPAVAQNTTDDRGRIARLQAQIFELEEQVRRLTGRLEEAEFGQRRIDGRLDSLIGDIDVRLRALEEGKNLSGSAEPDLPTVSFISPDVGSVGEPPEDKAQPEPDGQEGVLGTIPRDALLGIPTPSGDAPTAGNNVVEGDAVTRYSAIREMLASADFSTARPALEGFLQDFPEDPQASEASFMLGETWFMDQKFPEAAAQFAENFRSFGAEDNRAADNLLKLGMSLARIGDNERACTAFVEFERRYPEAGSALIQMAERERRTANCQ